MTGTLFGGLGSNGEVNWADLILERVNTHREEYIPSLASESYNFQTTKTIRMPIICFHRGKI